MSVLVVVAIVVTAVVSALALFFAICAFAVWVGE